MGLFSSSKDKQPASAPGTTSSLSSGSQGSSSKSHETKSDSKSSRNKKVRVDDKPKAEEQENDDEDRPKKQYAKEKVGVKSLTSTDPEGETETQVNTRLNALIYHVNDESVDMYKQENDRSDLLGRLYYDDYDSDSSFVPDAVQSPLVSPAASQVSTNDYFSSKINAAFRGDTPSSSAVNLDRTSSSSSLLLDSQSSASSRTRPHIAHIKSFERGISFDTSTNSSRRSLTLKLKHPKFKFRRNNKTFLTGFNSDQESLKAIEWLFDEMIVNGDTLIILQVLDEKKFDSIDRTAANKNLNKIEALNAHFKKISLVFEIVIGKPQKLLKKAIEEYSPAMMIVGTHHYTEGSNQHKGFLSKASISKHFLECALVPVIVVKPSYQYNETLLHPIDSEDYFQKWIGDVDLSGTYSKDKHKRRNRLTTVLSQTSSRNGSSTNLSALEREKCKPSVSPSRIATPNSQSYSHTLHIQLPGHRSLTPKTTNESIGEDRGRKSTKSKTKHDDDLDGFKFFTGGSRSRSTSRSRSRSRSRSVNDRLTRLFGHKQVSPSPQ